MEKYEPKPKVIRVRGGRVSEAEAEKRKRLLADIEALKRPLFANLAPSTRAAIGAKVATGKIAQGNWPRNAGTWTRGKN